VFPPQSVSVTVLSRSGLIGTVTLFVSSVQRNLATQKTLASSWPWNIL